MPVLDDEVEILDPIEIRLELLQILGLPTLVEADGMGELSPVPFRWHLLLELERIETFLLQDERQMIGERE